MDRRKILSVVWEYCHGKDFTIDAPKSIGGDGRASLVKLNDGSGYSFEYDLPLNGKWSDLTLQFEFRKRGQEFAVVLHGVHTL